MWRELRTLKVPLTSTSRTAPDTGPHAGWYGRGEPYWLPPLFRLARGAGALARQSVQATGFFVAAARDACDAAC